MAPDVVVRRCTLTIRGREGWGWGTDPNRYLAPALPAIEQALHRILAECEVDPGVDLLIDGPVRLAWGQDGTLTDGARQAFIDAVRRAADPLSDRPPAAPPADFLPSSAEAEAPSPAVSSTEPPDTLAALVSLLAGWSQSGRLPQILASWPTAIVRRWRAAVRAAAAAPDATELTEAAVPAIAGVVLAGPPVADGDRMEDRQLVLIGALLAAAGGRPLGTTTLDAVIRLTDPSSLTGRPGAPRPGTPAVSGALAVGPPPPYRPTETRGQPAHPSGLARRMVAPGLPFLVLAQLSRIGYLDALWAVASAAGDPTLAQLIAAGLAGKALPPPGRGWRRSRTEAVAVSVASGLPDGDVDSMAYVLRNRTELLRAPLDSALIALYAAGRAGSEEVVISATDQGVLLGESAGSLPIAWLPGGGDPAPVLDQLGQPPIQAADSFAPLAAELAPRRAFPHVEVPDLERHLGAAVGTALGSLAQELWGPETADAPMLALDRLADLEVELRLDRPLAVAIPRGQRWLDLQRVGLLDRWSIPWAPGGYWELVTW